GPENAALDRPWSSMTQAADVQLVTSVPQGAAPSWEHGRQITQVETARPEAERHRQARRRGRGEGQTGGKRADASRVETGRLEPADVSRPRPAGRIDAS